MTIINDNRQHSLIAAKNYDTMSFSKYADTLYTDSQIAGENSDLCNVSPDLQGSKDEYRLVMLQANKVAVMLILE